ncbi:fumarate reductase subunit C [Agarivorans sp. OAG1]|uniref:fumarate reductase subunit C n=1 Tax=unclassified Agarivorans TaxID=2636026 RepID=UPI00128C01AB|nr:fumarate reductase subunit C [Agarivorans sp. B2Z047]MPW31428.1 fumarate reductase subunit C [Agarivorans sp. B2Z047]UQN42471.1 fumarate reductase subunit C [Agarivorans sp. B2Z047]BEU01707.1 fumarate reductase subunit C [Agarivorans sp. OAG1]
MSKRKPYERKMGATWWLKNTFHTKYIIREGSSLVIAIYSFVLLFGLFRLSQGAEAFNGWLDAMSQPGWVVFHILSLAWTLYHSITWFSLAPKAANIWLGQKRVPDSWIVSGMYGALAVISLAGLILVLI